MGYQPAVEGRKDHSSKLCYQRKFISGPFHSSLMPPSASVFSTPQSETELVLNWDDLCAQSKNLVAILAFSPTSDLLATPHMDNVDVYLWTNQAQHAEVSSQGSLRTTMTSLSSSHLALTV